MKILHLGIFLLLLEATRYRSSGTNVYNEIEYFTSPDLMQRVVERLGLETNYYDKQFLRTRELYSNSPISLSLVWGKSYFILLFQYL
jgi:hypothetical protein